MTSPLPFVQMLCVLRMNTIPAFDTTSAPDKNEAIINTEKTAIHLFFILASFGLLCGHGLFRFHARASPGFRRHLEVVAAINIGIKLPRAASVERVVDIHVIGSADGRA